MWLFVAVFALNTPGTVMAMHVLERDAWRVVVAKQEVSPLNEELYRAIKGRDFPRLSKAIKGGADKDNEYNQAAFGNGGIHITTPLNQTIEMRWYEATELLLDKGADKEARDGNGCTPLFTATHYNDVPTVELLLVQGAHPTAKGANGETPLHKAAGLSTSTLLEKFIGLFDDVNDQDNWSKHAPLFWAVHWGWEENVLLLHKNGARLDVRDANGETLLHETVNWNSENTARLLLDMGIKIDATDDLGRTALYCAAEKGNVSFVKLLLSRGADIDIAMHGGGKALDVAKENSRCNCASLIREEIARRSVVALVAIEEGSAMSELFVPYDVLNLVGLAILEAQGVAVPALAKSGV